LCLTLSVQCIGRLWQHAVISNVIMAGHSNGQSIIFCSCGYFLLSFFPRLFSAVGNWMSTILPHMMWPYCEFRMQVLNVLHTAHWKYRMCAPSHNFVGLYLRNKACIDNRKKIVKQQYLLHMCSQYGELQPISGWDRFGSLGHPQQISIGFTSWLHYWTHVIQWRSTKLCTMFGCRRGWYIIYIYIFGGFCPMTEFCHVQYSLCGQVLRSPILEVLVHGTRVVGISQTLRRGTRNGIRELWQRVPPIFCRAAIMFCIGPHSSFVTF